MSPRAKARGDPLKAPMTKKGTPCSSGYHIFAGFKQTICLVGGVLSAASAISFGRELQTNA